MKKKTEKVKAEDILKPKEIVESFIIDPDWYTKHLKAEEEAKEKARKEEEERIKKIKCPSCKSISKEHVVKSENNGIFGSGYSSWVIDEYFVCNKCGTMFKDLFKIKNEQKRGNIKRM